MDTIVCVASGPSLTKEDVVACEKRFPLMVVNNAYQFADSPKYHYAGDTRWWRSNYALTQSNSCKFSIQANNRDQGYPDVEQMQRGFAECFSVDWPTLCTGYNSGFQAINLAYLLGFRRVVLLGYDMKFGTNNEKHFHPDYFDYNPLDTTILKWIRVFNKMAPKMLELVEVINVTRSTDLDCFPQVRLEDLLGKAV